MPSQKNQDFSYAGDISPVDTWRALTENANALLIDVRTPEEWAYVGIVDTAELGRPCLFVPWLFFPRMDPNPEFVTQVQHAAKLTDATPLNTPIYFICRSGVRSAYAAQRLAALGYTHCYNVAGGFEGDHDDKKHRGAKNGWKVANLPWTQG